ncbi:T9SS type A sorting domain-containing protein [bacterium]|nr:T9SS type A sorting domain-containing protein [bacterium]
MPCSSSCRNRARRLGDGSCCFQASSEIISRDRWSKASMNGCSCEESKPAAIRKRPPSLTSDIPTSRRDIEHQHECGHGIYRRLREPLPSDTVKNCGPTCKYGFAPAQFVYCKDTVHETVLRALPVNTMKIPFSPAISCTQWTHRHGFLCWRTFPMHSRLFTPLMGWILVAFSAFAAPLESEVADELSPLTVSEITVRSDGLSMTVAVEAPQWVEVETSSGETTMVLDYTHGGIRQSDGEPVVPTASTLFRIPPHSGVTVEVVNASYETYSDIEYGIFDEVLQEYAAPGDPSESEDTWLPGTLAEVGEPAILKDFRVANLITCPVQVNPSRREVRVYSTIDLEIRFEGVDERNMLPHWPTKISEAFLPIYRQFPDWSDSELDDYELYRGSVIVVMRDAAETGMEPWFEWKRQKGWTFEIIRDSDPGVNWTDNGIAAEIEDRYDAMETKADYVVVVGDNTGPYAVPPAGIADWFGRGYGDHEYSLVAGNDELSDVGVGRMSVENSTQLTAYVNKVIAYESDPWTTNDDWFQRGAVTVTSASSGYSTVLVGRYHRRCMFNIGFTEVDTSWVSPWGGLSGSQARAQMITAINEGVAFYAARGYIGSGLSTTDIGSLNNTNMLPVVIDLTCSTGNWASSYGINEAYMRAGTANSPKGAIGAFGNETSHTTPRYNNMLSTAAGYSYHTQRNPALGDMYMSAKYHIYKAFNGFDNAALNQFNHWFNLMGDPTVWLWSDVPQSMDVTHADDIEVGENTLSVTVEQNGEALQGAWVTFYKSDSDEEVIARGVTDLFGEVFLETPVRHSGDAVITVTMLNQMPYQQEISVNDPTQRVSFETVDFDDSGSNGTSGDGDGIPEAGETVGLIIEARNFGTGSQSDIEITGSSDDPFIVSITGTATLGSLAAGAVQEATGLVLVEIDAAAQNDWRAPIDLIFDADGGSWESGYSLLTAAPDFAWEEVNHVNGTIDPGETGQITIHIENIGNSDASGDVEGHLTSLEPELQIVQGTASFPNIPSGGSAVSGSFTVSAGGTMFPGDRADMQLVVTTAAGTGDTLVVPIYIGTRTATDPAGPDRYGYYAFDDGDTEYDQAPEFDWLEINPSAPNNDFSGELLDIHDTADDDDESVVVELPFEIQYYGVGFDSLTITANGWVALGNQNDMQNMRNYPIPSPGGPDYMIAPYWDERFTSTGGVYHYYDSAGDRYIVEWYNCGGLYNTGPSTFQVIFYDQASEHVTPSGDNNFTFQYLSMTHYQGQMGSGADVYWWTTGIENGTQDDGLELAYFNQHRPGTQSIDDGRAIFFTALGTVMPAVLNGTVTELATSEPLEAVQVGIASLNLYTYSNALGEYTLTGVPPGTYSVSAGDICHNTQTHEGIVFTELDTVSLDFQLTAPGFDLATEELEIHMSSGAEETFLIEFDNTGDGELSYHATLHYYDPSEGSSGNNGGPRGPGGELDEIWDRIYQFDLDPSESRYRGIYFDDEELVFWLTGSNNFDASGPNKIYKYSKYGEWLATYDQPVPSSDRSSQGFYGLTSDGEYFYAVDNGIMYEMEYSGDEFVVADTMEIPVNPARYIEYDPIHDWFWMGDFGNPVRAYDRFNQRQAYYGQDFRPYGCTWNEHDPDGFYLYFLGKQPGSQNMDVERMNPANGAHELVHEEWTGDPVWTPTGATITGWWNPLVYAIATATDAGNEDGVQLWELAPHLNYVSLANPEGTVPPGESHSIELDFDTESMPNDEYFLWVVIDGNYCGESVTVPVHLTVTSEVVDNDPVQPYEWALEGVYPNPFNPTTQIAFSLKSRAQVNIRVYNVMGREVAVLSERTMAAGRHTVAFNGQGLASGLYFLRFDAGPIHEVRKMILMK